jgi:hypothetical protein
MFLRPDNSDEVLRKDSGVSSLPVIKCMSKGCEGNLRPTWVEGEIEDVKGRVIPEWRHYRCERCGRDWTYDVWLNKWS